MRSVRETGFLILPMVVNIIKMLSLLPQHGELIADPSRRAAASASAM